MTSTSGHGDNGLASMHLQPRPPGPCACDRWGSNPPSPLPRRIRTINGHHTRIFVLHIAQRLRSCRWPHYAHREASSASHVAHSQRPVVQIQTPLSDNTKRSSVGVTLFATSFAQTSRFPCWLVQVSDGADIEIKLVQHVRRKFRHCDTTMTAGFTYENNREF